MTTYTAIPNGSVDTDSPVTQDLMTLLRDNPIAISEGASGAPYTSPGWHPDRETLVGASKADFYSGGVSSVESPNFQAGYDYKVVMRDFSVTGALSSLFIEGLDDSGPTWRTLVTASSLDTSHFLFGEIIFPAAKESNKVKGCHLPLGLHSSIGTEYIAEGTGGVYAQSASFFAFTRMRIRLSTGVTDNGNLYLYRRRNFYDGS